MDNALVHHDDTVAERHRFGLVVRDVDGGDAYARVQADQLCAHLHAELCVEVRERFVHQEHLRTAHEGTPDRDPLALAAGQLARPTGEQLFDAEQARYVVDALLQLALLDLLLPKWESEVRGDGHVWVERVVLEDHRDVALRRRQVVDQASADSNLAAGHLLEPCDHAQRGRLAAPGRPDQDEELSFADFEAQAVYGEDVRAELLADVIELNGRH